MRHVFDYSQVGLLFFGTGDRSSHVCNENLTCQEGASVHQSSFPIIMTQPRLFSVYFDESFEVRLMYISPEIITEVRTLIFTSAHSRNCPIYEVVIAKRPPWHSR